MLRSDGHETCSPALLCATLIACLLALAVPASAAVQGVRDTAGTPPDYLKTEGLSAPIHHGTLADRDGTRILPGPKDAEGRYLQRRRADGTWTGDLASGGSPDLASETMTTGRLLAGRYRVEVHSWAALPGTSVALEITFHNSAGTAGA